MKYCLTLLTIFIAFNHSLAQKDNSYRISIKASNIPSKKVYLNTMKRDAARNLTWPTIDSAALNDGIFILQRDTTLLEPSWSTSIFYIDSLTKKQGYLIFQNKFYPNKKSSSFILENTEITITGDIKSPKGLQLTGSGESDMDEQYGLLAPETHKLDLKIDSLKKAGNKTALASVINSRNDSLIAFKKKLFSLASQHQGSWMILLNVYQNASMFTPTELAQVIKIFNIKVMETPKGRSLSTFKQQSKNLVSGVSFPPFSYFDENRKKIGLNSVKGQKGTVIVFWASWCGPCRQEIPELKKLYQAYKSKGINMVSISTDHDIDAWKGALKKENMPWANVSNLPGDYKLINKTYNITAIPAIFLLDAQNKIVMPNDYQISILKENIEKMLTKN